MIGMLGRVTIPFFSPESLSEALSVSPTRQLFIRPRAVPGTGGPVRNTSGRTTSTRFDATAPLRSARLR